MKTFFDLIQEVQKPGRCHRCGGCVTFCTAINYGALEMDADGKPRYAEIERCIECGLCHAICPEIGELEEETRRRASWSEPMGRILETAVARAADPAVQTRGTDGGAVTALLLHLFDQGRIDGAIVAKQVAPFQRRPHLAVTREEILESAGFFFDTSHGLPSFGERYKTYASIEEFDLMAKQGLRRVALVGTPCQIQAVRRMQVLDLVPSDAIAFCFGLFCSGNFIFEEAERRLIAEKVNVDWDQVAKVNIKEDLMLHLTSGRIKSVPLKDLDAIRRHACRFCTDYAAEYADIAFGGIGAEEGWTTVLARTPLGRAVLAHARGAGVLQGVDYRDNPRAQSAALSSVQAASARKKEKAAAARRESGTPSVRVQG